MQRVFIELPGFIKEWTRLELTAQDMSLFQDWLLPNPKTGDLVKGTNGIRKVRWAHQGKGKRGGVRVFYLDLEKSGRLYFLAVIAKNESENFTKAQLDVLRQMVSILKRDKNEKFI